MSSILQAAIVGSGVCLSGISAFSAHRLSQKGRSRQAATMATIAFTLASANGLYAGVTQTECVGPADTPVIKPSETGRIMTVPYNLEEATPKGPNSPSIQKNHPKIPML